MSKHTTLQPYDYLIQKRLSEHTGCTASQVQTLLVLLDFPIMDYGIVRKLKLFPPSKMRNRVLDPLHKAGWVIFHSYPPSDSNLGASRLAWSLAPGMLDQLQEMVAETKTEVARNQKSALLDAEALAEHLGL